MFTIIEDLKPCNFLTVKSFDEDFPFVKFDDSNLENENYDQSYALAIWENQMRIEVTIYHKCS